MPSSTRRGLWPLALLVAVATIVFPLAKIFGSLYVLMPLRRGRGLPGAAQVYRWVETLRPWAMMEVFLLGVIVAYVKLTDFATIDLGPAVFAFSALIVIVTARRCGHRTARDLERLGAAQRPSGGGALGRQTRSRGLPFLPLPGLH